MDMPPSSFRVTEEYYARDGQNQVENFHKTESVPQLIFPQ
jgi:hypothetical protein